MSVSFATISFINMIEFKVFLAYESTLRAIVYLRVRLPTPLSINEELVKDETLYQFSSTETVTLFKCELYPYMCVAYTSLNTVYILNTAAKSLTSKFLYTGISKLIILANSSVVF
jgi:hypothetical protein